MISLDVGTFTMYLLFNFYLICGSLIVVKAQFSLNQLFPYKLPEGLHFYLGENSITRHFCKKSVTVVNGIHPCEGGKVFGHKFEKHIDQNVWIVEQYIAAYGDESENFDFVTYINSRSNLFVSNKTLYIRPIPINDRELLQSTWNFNDYCTSQMPTACSHTAQAGFILPPVISGKLRSKFTFKYGRIDIRAKLPSGDWIFPIIKLVSVKKANVKIIIALARGNDQLTTSNGEDIGSRVLYGGPILNMQEIDTLLHVFNATEPFNVKMRTYSCVWLPDQIKFYVDDKEYGTTISNLYPDLNNSEFYINIGVGVGGVSYFPDNLHSNGYTKPWKNKSRRNINDFLQSLNIWSSTWNNGQETMQIESVRVTAI